MSLQAKNKLIRHYGLNKHNVERWRSKNNVDLNKLLHLCEAYSNVSHRRNHHELHKKRQQFINNINGSITLKESINDAIQGY